MGRAESLKKYNNSEKGRAAQLRYRRTVKGKALSRRAKLRYYYKMTEKEYTDLLFEQDGACGICGRQHTEFKKRLYIDHDHVTNKVRGLLCNACNRHLGIWEAGNRTYKHELAEKYKKYLKGNR